MTKCKKCGKQRKYLSHKKLCHNCFTRMRDLAIMQMANKKGAAWNKWKIGMSKYVESLQQAAK